MSENEQHQGKTADGRGYDAAAVAILLLFLALLLRLWSRLPVIIDSWYHLGVIRAFSEKGVGLYAWWEFAPFGRPHLYSPLFHVIYLGLLRLTGCSLLDLGRLYDVVTFPLVLFAGWWAARLLFGSRAAFVTLLLLSLNAGLLFPCSLIMMPGTYAMMLWPFVHILVLRKNITGAALLLSVVGYFHFAVAGVAILSLLILVAFRREYARTALWVAVLAGLIFSPWLIHLCLNREFLHAGVSTIPVFIPLFSVLAALLGIAAIVKCPEKEPLAILSIIIACVLFLFALRERFWTYGGFTFAILGGYGVERFARGQFRWVILLLAISCLSVTPFLKRWQTRLGLPIPFQSTPLVLGTPFLTLAEWQMADKAAELPKPVSEDIGALADWIGKNVSRDEVLLTDDRHLGAHLFVLTGRRTTAGLWEEIMTDDLKLKLAEVVRASPGYIIISVAGQPAPGPAGKVDEVAAFGRFRVFHRSP